MNIKSKIVSTGSYIPKKIVDNTDLKQFPAVGIRLIEQKTGIKSRRFAEKYQCTSDLAALAAKKCLKTAKINPQKLDCIILSTSSPDRIQPATATRVQYLVGAKNACAFDINSVCSGSIFAICVADSMIKAGLYKNILVVGSEIYSRYLNPNDFSTYPYFGDGAGALLLSAASDANSEILCSILKTDGSKFNLIQIPAGGTMLPYSEVKDDKDFYFRMQGREVYKFAVTEGTNVVKEILKITGINRNQIKFIIPHQANVNIIKELSKRLNFKYDKFVVDVDRYGNTAAASVLISLDELMRTRKAKTGDLIILVAFGGGLSWGATLIRL